MNLKKFFPPFVALAFAAALLGLWLGLLSANPALASPPAAPQAVTDLVPVTVITVTSGTDPDDSQSRTCYTDPVGPPGPPTAPCTLRRAIIEASNLPAASRPILIKFNIPATVEEGNDSILGVWKIHLYNTTQTVVLGRMKDGQITIDGSTQPGGRISGPKIILIGPGGGQRDGIVVGDVAGDNSNVIRGLAFQNFKTHMYVNTNFNVIENNWFGLTADGLEAALRNDNPEDGSGNSGVALTDGAQDNTIQNNVFLGLDGVSAALLGDRNTFAHNLVGTAADGNVPGKQTDPSLICTPVDWLGGGGISVSGNDHIIEDNRFAGLRQAVFSLTVQPDTIRVGSGGGHTIQSNIIGVAANNAKVGVCGRGIYLIDSPDNVLVLNNRIVDPGMSAISLNGALYDANTLRGNITEKGSMWPDIDGMAVPENAIQIGKSLPAAYQAFLPAKVTSIDGTQVQGISGNGSLCPNCVVELFLDDTDVITETLQTLAVVTANAGGNWTAILPAALTASQGIRTTSTSAQYNTIPGMSAGTTCRLSELYTDPDQPPPGGEYQVFLPMTKK